MRFQYDPITDSSIKYNDRFEFYEQINLAEAMGIDDDSKEDQFRSETTFSFTVENVGQLKSQRLSPPVYVRMLPWKIMVIPNDRALGFFLQCNGENDSPTWSCNAIAELRLKCHKPDAQRLER